MNSVMHMLLAKFCSVLNLCLYDIHSSLPFLYGVAFDRISSASGLILCTMVTLNHEDPNCKRLVKDIEFRGGRHRADFLGICEDDKDFYGTKGSTKRRAFQQARDRLCRRFSARAYLQLALDCNAEPSRTTKQEAKMEELRAAMEEVRIIDDKVFF